MQPDLYAEITNVAIRHSAKRHLPCLHYSICQQHLRLLFVLVAIPIVVAVIDDEVPCVRLVMPVARSTLDIAHERLAVNYALMGVHNVLWCYTTLY